MLADANKNMLLEYSDVNGQLLRNIQGLGREDSGPFRPSFLQSNAEGLAILENNGRISWINSNLTATKSFKLTDTKNSSGLRLGSVFSWVLAGKTILTFSDLEKERTWSSAFLRIPASNPHDFSTIPLPPLDEEGRNLYLYGHPYIAASSTHGYVLLMQAQPAIFEFALNGGYNVRKLAVGSLLGTRPRFPKKEGLGTVRALYAQVEKSSMPVGLYYESNRLFVLSRTPKRLGTKWLLHRISPSTNQVEATFEIMSTANHLTVIPGPNSWAFVEKGPVLGLGEQSVSGVFTISSGALLRSASGQLCANVR